MADEKNVLNTENEENSETEVYTLTDETGKESDFELLLSLEIEGQTYYALAPVEETDEGEEDGSYVVLKLAEEAGEQVLITIDDDDEFEKIAGIFDDALFGEVDHDETES